MSVESVSARDAILAAVRAARPPAVARPEPLWPASHRPGGLSRADSFAVARRLIAAGADWRTSTLNIGGTAEEPLIKLGTGQVLGSLLDFLIVALLVFWFAKKILKEEAVTKK